MLDWSNKLNCPWVLMCFGYGMEMCDILCMPLWLSTCMQKLISLIRFMIIKDIHIDWLVVFCNKFAQYISNDQQFINIGEFIVISILKNFHQMSFRPDFIYHVIGKIYYYSGKLFEAELYFDKSLRSLEEGQ